MMPNDILTASYADMIEKISASNQEQQRAGYVRAWNGTFCLGSALIEFLIICNLSIGIAIATVGSHSAVIGNYISVSMVVAIVSVMMFKNGHLYKVEMVSDIKTGLSAIAKTWTLIFLCLTMVSVLTKTSDEYSRLWFSSWYFAGLMSLLIERAIVSRIYAHCVKKGLLSHSVVVIGASGLTASFLDRVANNRHGIKVTAIFDDLHLRGLDPEVVVDVDGDLNELLRYQAKNRIDTIVIALPLAEKDRLRKVVRHLSIQPVKIRILPSELAFETQGKWYAPFGEVPGIQLMRVSDRPIALYGYFAKSMLDKFAALMAIIVFGPLMIACAIGIKIASPGPVFFMQERIGYQNRIFHIYKFRSMHSNACNTGMLTQRNDKRVFKFGEIMRKLSFDELPQLFNVLKGDMSLVGPRPHMPEARAAGRYYYDVVSEYAHRHRVKPGITGWAQVNGWRGPTETVEQIEQRVRHDLYYIENWSLGLDVSILAKTVLVGFVGKNAF